MYQRKWIWLVFLASLLLSTTSSYASFIETTIGTAVVNDATASYFNPAALMLVKNTQIIPLATVARFQTQFTGQTTAVSTGFVESGTSNSTSNFYSPSLYLAVPMKDKIVLGFAVVSNFANRNPEEHSLLRYVQSSNTIQDYDFVPSVGVRINKYISVGAGINFSRTNFDLHPIVGFPGSTIADSDAHNQSSGSGIGGNIGFLIQPTPMTLIGFNYRSTTTYNEKGKSTFNGSEQVVSNNYHFKMRTPPHITLSLSQLITPTLGVITTIQRIHWNIIKNINIYGIASTDGRTPIIVDASVPYYLHDTWLLTVGGNYRFKPNWVIRAAATYSQSPDNDHYQISTSDSYVLGSSLGWDVNKIVTIDGSYAHAFMQNNHANVVAGGNRFLISGTNQCSRDVVSLKVTFNI